MQQRAGNRHSLLGQLGKCLTMHQMADDRNSLSCSSGQVSGNAASVWGQQFLIMFYGANIWWQQFLIMLYGVNVLQQCNKCLMTAIPYHVLMGEHLKQCSKWLMTAIPYHVLMGKHLKQCSKWLMTAIPYHVLLGKHLTTAPQMSDDSNSLCSTG